MTRRGKSKSETAPHATEKCLVASQPLTGDEFGESVDASFFKSKPPSYHQKLTGAAGIPDDIGILKFGQAWRTVKALAELERSAVDRDNQVEIEQKRHILRKNFPDIAQSLEIPPVFNPEQQCGRGRVSPDVVKRREIVRQNPLISAAGLCPLFDAEQVPLPQRTKEAGSWERAYASRIHRHAVESLISRDRVAIDRQARNSRSHSRSHA